jgi:hypothetical protein
MSCSVRTLMSQQCSRVYVPQLAMKGAFAVTHWSMCASFLWKTLKFCHQTESDRKKNIEKRDWLEWLEATFLKRKMHRRMSRHRCRLIWKLWGYFYFFPFKLGAGFFVHINPVWIRFCYATVNAMDNQRSVFNYQILGHVHIWRSRTPVFLL